MEEENTAIALDFSNNPKNTALYFDYMIPIDFDFVQEYLLMYKFINMNLIFPKQMKDKKVLYEYLRLMRDYYDKYVTMVQVMSESGVINENTVERYAIKLHDDVVKFLIDNTMNNIIHVINSNKKVFCQKSYEYTALKLAQLPLIDANRTDWSQIIQFREDKESANKLRRLKLFFHENYSDKENNYIQDDLLQRIEDYNRVVKKWGFETLLSSLTLLNTSITSVGSSLVIALTGQPLEVAATSGACIGIGNILLHIAKEKHKLMNLRNEHPLAYIFEAKKRLEK